MDAAPSTLLGRYRLGPRLGSGGMAEVRRADDLALGRPVAVKLLHPHLAADPAFMERFDREARLAAGLSHPNVVAIFDRGVADGRPFLVMELVEGESLSALLRRAGPLPPERALAIADDVLAALEHAHGRGVVHRDVAPHNVLLAPDGRAKLADFGIAQAAAAAALTAPGEVFGSLRYVAPERLAGEPGTAAADLYGVGAILYEALTGRAPFEGDHPVAIAAQHASAAPRPPSAVRPDLPPWLDALVLRALAKEPGARFPSAAAMRGALVGWAAHDGATVPFATFRAGGPLPLDATAPLASSPPGPLDDGRTAPLSPGSAAGSTAVLPPRSPRGAAAPPTAGAPPPLASRPGGMPLVLAAVLVFLAIAGLAVLSLSRAPSAAGPTAAAGQGASPTRPAAAKPAAAASPTRAPSTPTPPAAIAPTRPPPSPTPAPPSPTPLPSPTPARPTATPPAPAQTAAGLTDRLNRIRDLLEDAAAAARTKPGRGKDGDSADTVRALLERLDEAQRHLAAGRVDAARDQLRELAARLVADAARGRIDRELAGRILAELQGLAAG